MSDDRDIYETLGRPPKLTPLQEFEIRQYREAGATIKQCAGLAGVSVTTVYRVLRKQREKFGLEKLPNRQSARSDAARGIIHKPQ
jgi:DNA invertase Pin-like site-specific DNA recombinase